MKNKIILFFEISPCNIFHHFVRIITFYFDFQYPSYIEIRQKSNNPNYLFKNK
jgi:hypothetical protein